MKRAILAFAAGLVLWILVISVLNRGLRVLIPGYALAEPTMSFTLGMQAARLVIGALTSLIAGAVAGWIAPASPKVPLLLGVVLLIAFVPAMSEVRAPITSRAACIPSVKLMVGSASA